MTSVKCDKGARSLKGWIQTEACVIPSYHGMSIMWQKQIET